MESAHENGSSSVDLRTRITSNLGEDENFNPRKEQLESSSSPSTSKNHLHFMPNTKTHHNGATTSPTSEFHSTSEKGVGSKRHLEAYHATNPFGETHNSQFENSNLAFSSHNPFLLPSENLKQENGVNIGKHSFSRHDDDDDDYDYDSFNGEMLSLHSSQLGNNNNNNNNLFEVQTRNTNTLNGASFSHNFDVDDDKNHYHKHESLPHHNHGQEDWRIISNNNTIGDESHVTSSNQHLDPFFAFEEESSTQNQNLPNPTHKTHVSANFSTNIEPNHSMVSNLGTSKSSFSPASKSSTQDHIHYSISPPSKMEEKNSNLNLDSSDDSDDDIPISSSVQNHGSETQNPPIQVMERTWNNPATTTTTRATSKYRIPSHVFARNKSKTEWSTLSNESLFSIQMGNTSFSREMSWYNKSGELYNNKSSELHMSGPLPPHRQPQQRQQSPVNKFSDMGQISAEQNEGWGVTEEKAAETMREVIMEESLRKESSSNEAPSLYIRHCDSTDHSNHSNNGSTKSFAFKISTDGDRTLSSKHVEELTKQQKQIEQQTIMKETPNAAQTAKSSIKNNNSNNNNAPQNIWLSCFTCCNN